ncbi:MAG TPA: leucine-rich repeat domain-containing protein [Oceanipulchritudo sp.]|nr:leucine-rich repeat domain-containing protein [Oceanipulchritudo sp.]
MIPNTHGRFLNILFTVTLAVIGPPIGLQGQDYEYDINNGEVTIIKFVGNAEQVIIPSEIEGFPVTKIGDYAFWANLNLKSVTIPGSVTSIGAEAFLGGSYLEEILVEGGNLFYSSRDGVLFDKAAETLLRFPSVREGEYVIPDTVTTIGEWAFNGCSLTKVTIPDSVLRIEDNAFYCGLKSLTIPASVVYLGQGSLYIGWPGQVYFLGDPPATGSWGPFWDKAAYWYGQVFYIEGMPGWAAASNDPWQNWPYVNIYAVDDKGQPTGEAFVPFDPDWLWGKYEIAEVANCTYCNTGDWMGWVEVSYSPWVWSTCMGTWFYIVEPVAAANHGWVYVPDLQTSQLWSFLPPEFGWAWCPGLNMWMYATPSGWAYLVG